MPYAPKPACPVCRRLNCTEHKLPTWTHKRPSSYQEQKRNREVVAAWIEQHGYICPGWGREPHPSEDLTADHLIPVGNGGDQVGGPMSVLCRSCNSRRGQALQLRRG